MATSKKPVKFIEQWSESVWISLVVKALRLGWPAGIREGARHLSPSRVRDALIVQVFEDIFPAVDELNTCLFECRQHSHDALCQRQTCHGRIGLTEACKPVVMEWVHRRRDVSSEGARLFAAARQYKLFLPRRALSEFDAWLMVQPQDSGQKRDLDLTPWQGMPDDIIDLHTYEGKRDKKGVTLLSGTEPQHLVLAQLVQTRGWPSLRAEVHSRIAPPPLPPPSEPSLF
jgi:hypothetical protein